VIGAAPARSSSGAREVEAFAAAEVGAVSVVVVVGAAEVDGAGAAVVSTVGNVDTGSPNSVVVGAKAPARVMKKSVPA
ncbi:MAG TPA: hypothetical protein PLP95_13410, partial [Microthrixaceae bacterium]|nr:hypothetical protein [Microthrixaceae bacterium]